MSYLSYFVPSKGRHSVEGKKVEVVRDFVTGILCGIGDVAEKAREGVERKFLTMGQKVFGERWDESDARGLLDIVLYAPVMVITVLVLFWMPGLLM